MLWYRFLKEYPVQFRRQYVIGEYITDFYCHRAGLVVELDGSGHYEPENIMKDNIRTNYLKTQGVTVMRFSNLDVLKHFDAVCEEIDKFIKFKINKQ